jgi:hypothetical protein
LHGSSSARAYRCPNSQAGLALGSRNGRRWPPSSTLVERQLTPRFRTEPLQRGSRQVRADFVVKVLEEVPKPRRSDYASNMIPRSAVVRNGIPRIAQIGMWILSVNAALDIRQDTDRLLQQNLPKAAVSTRSDVCQSGRQQDYRCPGDWGCHYAVLARPLSSSRAMAHCCGTCAVEGGFRSHRAGSDPEERQHAHPAIERLLSRLPLSLFSSPIVRLRPAASLCNTPPERPTSNMREVGRA